MAPVKKLRYLFFFLLLLAESAPVHASAPTQEALDSLFFEVRSLCDDLRPEQECLALLQARRHDPKYGHPSAQFEITQAVVSISRRPAVLQVAYDILTDLLRTGTEQVYLAQRASVRYYQDPVAGFCEAKDHGLPGTLATLLEYYLKSGDIRHDIVTYSIEQFEQALESGERIRRVIGIVQSTLSRIEAYADKGDNVDFMNDARNLIPWESWRKGEWSEAFGSTTHDANSASDLLLTYCAPAMLTLDDGEFCADAVQLISVKVDQSVFSDDYFRQWARQAITWIEQAQPRKIGEAAEILKKSLR